MQDGIYTIFDKIGESRDLLNVKDSSILWNTMGTTAATKSVLFSLNTEGLYVDDNENTLENIVQIEDPEYIDYKFTYKGIEYKARKNIGCYFENVFRIGTTPKQLHISGDHRNKPLYQAPEKGLLKISEPDVLIQVEKPHLKKLGSLWNVKSSTDSVVTFIDKNGAELGFEFF